MSKPGLFHSKSVEVRVSSQNCPNTTRISQPLPINNSDYLSHSSPAIEIYHINPTSSPFQFNEINSPRYTVNLVRNKFNSLNTKPIPAPIFNLFQNLQFLTDQSLSLTKFISMLNILLYACAKFEFLSQSFVDYVSDANVNKFHDKITKHFWYIFIYIYFSFSDLNLKMAKVNMEFI